MLHSCLLGPAFIPLLYFQRQAPASYDYAMGLVGWILAKAHTSVSQGREQMCHIAPAPQFFWFKHFSELWEPHFG